MIFEHVALQSLAIREAPEIVTSAEIERRIGALATRIGLARVLTTLTGVERRRLWPPGTPIASAASAVGRDAIEAAGIAPERVGLVVNTSVCRDMLEPSIASTVHAELGLSPRCRNFDLTNACLAFLDGMEVAALLIERRQIDYALIVDAEGSRDVLENTVERLARPGATEAELRQDFATLTLGSGAAAVVLCHADLATTPHRFRGGVSLAATEHNRLCYGDYERMVTNAGDLLKAGVALASRTWRAASDRLGWSDDDVPDEVVMHQVGSVHMATIMRELGLPLPLATVTYADYGNIGPAAIPFTLAKARETGRVFAGDRIALMGIGSGLNCTMMEIVW